MVWIYLLLKSSNLSWLFRFLFNVSQWFLWCFFFQINAVIGSFLKVSLKFPFFCNILQFFIIVLVKIGKNRLYVITRGYLSDFCRVSLSVIMLILLSRLIISIYSLINDELYPVLRSYFSFPWDYCLNLLDLNLFAGFGWLDCKVNYLWR